MTLNVSSLRNKFLTGLRLRGPHRLVVPQIIYLLFALIEDLEEIHFSESLFLTSEHFVPLLPSPVIFKLTKPRMALFKRRLK